MKRLASATLILSLLVACDRSSPPETAISAEAEAPAPAAIEQAAVAELNFAETALAFHSDATAALNQTHEHCQQLFSTIDSFVTAPSSERQLAAQAAFVPCLQSWRSAALYFQKPFSLAEAADFHLLMDLIDTRPFLPGYIDGIPEYPYSGLVHELDLPMDESALRSQHRLMDEESASLGFPVIEFFLWRTELVDVWLPEQPDKAINVQRRIEYLNVAAKTLQRQLLQALDRWQDKQFDYLPERVKLNFILQSCQRLVMVDLLNSLFEDAALNEPEWHHPAQISGNGRSYPLAMLQTLQSFVGSTEQSSEFTRWLQANEQLPVSAESLAESISKSLNAIERLPENYPAQSEPNDQWQAARQSLAELTLQFSELMRYYEVPLLVE